MKYIDSRERVAEQTYGDWLIRSVTDEARKVRWQSGFFNSEPLGLIERELRRVSTSGEGVLALVGSNDGATTEQSIADLVAVLDLPQAKSLVGVVSLEGGIYHPKTFHIERNDGSQAAYVGSSNLTGSGVSLHIEAGLATDTREGDSEVLLSLIGAAVDAWFDSPPAGLHVITDAGDIQALVDEEVLGVPQPARSPRTRGGGGVGTPAGGGRLARVIPIPRLTLGGVAAAPAPARVVVGLSLGGYPAEVLFAPGAVGATSGAAALSGSPLRDGAVGLVVRLTRDSTKRFDDRPGTSYVSLPMEVLGSILFGIHGDNRLPRAEFGFAARYISTTGELRSTVVETNITLQGVGPSHGATHRNLRLLVPSVVSDLADDVRRAGLHIPVSGDVALVHWPTKGDPVVRITFADSATSLHAEATRRLDGAIAGGTAVGQESATWAERALLPEW